MVVIDTNRPADDEPRYAKFQPPPLLNTEPPIGICGNGPKYQIELIGPVGTQSRLLAPMSELEDRAWPFLKALTDEVNALVDQRLQAAQQAGSIPSGCEPTVWMSTEGLRFAMSKPLPSRDFVDINS